MAGIDNLKSRLLEEDRLSAESIETDAAKKADELIAAALKKAEEITESMSVKAQKDGQDKKDRLLARAAHNARNNLLEAKQEAIEKI